MEPCEITIDMEDFAGWVRKLCCFETDVDGVIMELPAGKGAAISLKDPISTVLLKTVER